MKRRHLLLKNIVLFTKNGGTFYQKRRYISLKTKVHFTKNGGMTFPDLTRHFFVILAE